MSKLGIRRMYLRPGCGNRPEWREILSLDSVHQATPGGNSAAIVKAYKTSINCGVAAVKRCIKFYKTLRPLTVMRRLFRWRRMPRFVGRDLRFVLQGETDVVKTVQQAVAHELIDGELCAESSVVSHFAMFEINRKVVAVHLSRATHELSDFWLAQLHRKKSILRAVVSEDVGE